MPERMRQTCSRPPSMASSGPVRVETVRSMAAWVMDGASVRVSRRSCAPRYFHGSRKEACNSESEIGATKEQQEKSSVVIIPTCPGTVGQNAGRGPALSMGEGSNRRCKISLMHIARWAYRRASTVMSVRRRGGGPRFGPMMRGQAETVMAGDAGDVPAHCRRGLPPPFLGCA